MTYELAIEYLELCHNNPKQAIFYAVALIVFLAAIYLISKLLDNKRI